MGLVNQGVRQTANFGAIQNNSNTNGEETQILSASSQQRKAGGPGGPGGLKQINQTASQSSRQKPMMSNGPGTMNGGNQPGGGPSGPGGMMRGNNAKGGMGEYGLMMGGGPSMIPAMNNGPP